MIHEFRGAPREVGRQHGETFGDSIRGYIETYCRFPHLPRERRAALALECLERLEAFCPAPAEELRGIAEGAGLPLEDVCALNFQNLLRFAPADDACSNIMFRASDRGPLLGKNADLGIDAPCYTALFAKRYDNGLALAGYGYRGYVSLQGVTNRGLATGGSSVTLDEPPARPSGLPDSMVMAALPHRCRTVEEAVKLLRDAPFFGKGVNVALLDASGDAAVVERSRTHFHVVRAGTKRWLACTNFLLSGRKRLASSPAYVANAKARYEIISRLIRDAEELTLDAMLAILRHRAADGVSICQRDEQLNMHSRPSYVAMPAERAVLLTDDYPDRSKFREYAL